MFICKICQKHCHQNYSGTHLKKEHNYSGKEYYDEFIKMETDGKCLICLKNTKFKTIKNGYSETCSVACANKLKNEKLFKKTGKYNLFQLDEIKNKSKETIKIKYGVDNISKNPEIKKKKMKTLIKNYGVEFGLQNLQIKNKQKETMMKIYGVEHPMSSQELLNKAFLNGAGKCRIFTYQTIFGDIIKIQGNLEKCFVKLCEENKIRILNGPRIKYYFKGKIKNYFCDFKIQQNNNWRLVEIKSLYYYETYKDIVITKSNSAIEFSKENNMLDFTLIIDKVYIP